MIDIRRRLEKLEQKQSAVPLAYVFFEDGRREKWDLAQISRAFLGDGCGVVRVEWLRNEQGVIYELFSDEQYWAELAEVRQNEN